MIQYQTIKSGTVFNEFQGKNVMDWTKFGSGGHLMCVGRSKTDTTVTGLCGVGTSAPERHKYAEAISILSYNHLKA